jgi:hypothetical protein
MAPEDTEVRLQCPESPKLVRVIRGEWWLAMSAGCKASTSSWEIVARDKTAVKEETVVVSVHTNVTAWTGEAFNFTVDTPARLQSVCVCKQYILWRTCWRYRKFIWSIIALFGSMTSHSI